MIPPVNEALCWCSATGGRCASDCKAGCAYRPEPAPSVQFEGATPPGGRKNPVRTEVRRLGLLMELKLRKNDFKGGWADMSNETLLARLDGEVAELREALLSGDPLDIAQEAADVANFAMMLADNAGGI